MKISNFKSPTVQADLVAFQWLKDRKPSSIEGFEYNDNRYESNMDRMGNLYTCQVIAIGPKVSQVKPGDLFLIHEFDKVNQGDEWFEDEVLFCRESNILCIPDKVTEVTERERELTKEEEQEIIDVL